MATDESPAAPLPPPPPQPEEDLQPAPAVPLEEAGSDAPLSNDGNGTIAAIDVAGGVDGVPEASLFAVSDVDRLAAGGQAMVEISPVGADRKRNGDARRSCACKKSHCLKLYCPCFASGEYCPESCGCQPCYNKSIYAEAVQSAHREASMRSRRAPAPKALHTVEANGMETVNKIPSSNQVKRGCSCKKSNCEKKYCDCYETKGGCSVYCKCIACLNPYGRKEGSEAEECKNFIFTGADIDQTDDEDDIVEERSPNQQSPLSRESSFQNNPGNGRNTLRDRHIFAQPLSQRQPQHHPWFSAKRQQANGRADDAATMGALIEYKPPGEWQLVRQEEQHYSIPRCIDIMNNMADLSQQEKSVAPDVFLQANNREIFVSLSSDVRTMWLRRKIQQLT